MVYDHDVIVVGGGLGGAALGMVLARHGINVLVLERDTTFRDRVRGEYMHPWGVTEARTLDIYDLLKGTCGYETRFRLNHIRGLPPPKRRDLLATSPHQVGSLHFYHPAMQEVLLQAASQAGAKIKRGVTVIDASPGRIPAVRVRTGDGEQSYQARLVVGADGRGSPSRKWGQFTVQQDPDRMIIAGILLDDLDAPEGEVNFFIHPERSLFTVFTPLGDRRFRSYAGFYQQEGYHRLSGDKAVPDYIAGSIDAGAPPEWFTHVRKSGPLASFNCAESWVNHPYQQGIALVGDAAATSDPSFGCGLSLTLRDVRVLSEHLTAGGDWEAAAHDYAHQHDRYFASSHRLLDWLIRLFYEPGETAAMRRQKAFARIIEDPSRLPEIIGLGPETPSDEAAYHNLFGDE